jgi:flagellar basal body-associated protein FliL
MFHNNTKNKKMWIALIVVAVLVVITMLLQAQILAILSDMQAFILRSSYVMDANPLPAMPVNYVMDSNPLPIRTF